MISLSNIFPTKKALFLLVILVFSSFAGNYLCVPLFFGVDFLFGSIAVLISLYLYGIIPGLLTAIIASSYTYILWGHPYAIIIFFCEALFVGQLLRRNNHPRICFADGIFWIFVGMPMVWLFYFKVMNMDSTATLLIMLKQSVNGFFNALVASIIVNFLPVRKWIGLAVEHTISLKQIVFGLLVTFVLFPTLLLMVVNSRQEFDEIETNIITRLENEHTQIVVSLYFWQQHHLHAVATLARVAAENKLGNQEVLQKSTELIKQANTNFHNMYIADATGTTIAFYPQTNELGKKTIGLNFSDRPYFREAKATLQPVMSDVFTGRGGVFVPIVTISVPVLSENQFTGIATGTLNLSHITKLLQLNSRHQALQLTIVDRDNRVVASTHSHFKPMQQFDRYKGGDVRQLGEGCKTAVFFADCKPKFFKINSNGHLFVKMPIYGKYMY